MKKSSSSFFVNRSRWQAPNALGANVVRNRSRLCCDSSASSSTPARCATPGERRQLRADPLQQLLRPRTRRRHRPRRCGCGTGSAR